jgi:hypothetical protein
MSPRHLFLGLRFSPSKRLGTSGIGDLAFGDKSDGPGGSLEERP